LDKTTQQHNHNNHNNHNNRRTSMAQKIARTSSGAMPALSETAFRNVIENNDDLAKFACEVLAALPAAKQMELGHNVVKSNKMHGLISVMLENSEGAYSEASAKKMLAAIDDANILRNPFVLKRQFDALQVQRHYYSNDQLPNDKVFTFSGYHAFKYHTEKVDGYNVKFWKYNGSQQAVQKVKAFCIEELQVGERYIKTLGNEFYCAFIPKDFPLSVLETGAIEVDNE